MQTKWYIEKEFFWEYNPDTIITALNKMQVPYYLQRFKQEYSYDVFSKDDCVIVHGSIEFIKKVGRDTSWYPGVSWVNTQNLLCSTYYSHFSDYMLNQEYCFITLSELKRKKDFYLSRYS